MNIRQPTWDEFHEWFFATVRGRTRGTLARSMFLVNAHTLNLASGDAGYRAVLNRADVVLNDGVGVELYGRLARQLFKYNFNGTDLVPRLFNEATIPITVFLYGAAPGRGNIAARSIESNYPNVRVVGAMDGFEEDSPIDAINAVRPDLLLVGLGNPRQERWIDANHEHLDVGVAAGVGALIDFMSGATTRAPQFIRRARLEWAFRLAIEPRRMFKRYVLGNPIFVVRSIRYLIGARGRHGSART